MTPVIPVLTTFMSKRIVKCPACEREIAVRSDGRYEKHNRKNERKPCKNSHQPSGMKDVRKPDKKDRVALMKHLVASRNKDPSR